MGKVIVENIKGMGWKVKTSLILVFTMISTIAIYGWFGMRGSEAAIQQLQAWTNVYHSATAMNPATASFSVGAGNNRMLVVGVSATLTSSGTQTVGTVSYGGTSMTLALGDAATSARQHSYLFYLPLGTVTAADAAKTLSVSVTGGTALINDIYYTVYTGVNQASAVTGTQNYNSGSTLVSSAAFATALAVNANDQAVILYNLNNTGSTTAPGYTLSTGWTLGATQTWTTTNGERSLSAYYAPPASNTTNTGSITVTGVTARVSMTGMSLKAATTTLGNGVVGTTANVPPGATGQKLDGFSLVTGTTGTTDSVTGLTVTTTNQAAIASMQIWNEAGTTQYFGTVTNPGSDTWSFSGGTAIPVTSTAANYKIVVSYKTRAAGAPPNNTATTASVTAITSGNVKAGSDTADTTLTLLNTHNASLWGTATTGDAQITLNWSYGTPGQSVIIVRYTANTDSTKPVDGTSYGVGTALGTGVVRYNNNGTTFTDTTVVNGTTYYYKIFEYDTQYTNYYNATDVWKGPLTPLSPDAVKPTVDAGFAAATPVKTLTVPITGLSATDNVGGSGVSGYLITTSPDAPSAGAAGWTSTPPANFTVAAAGTYTLYPWAKDGGGNVSPTYGAPVTVVVDTSAPSVSAFSMPAQVASRTVPVSSLTGTDSGGSGVAGYLVTTSSAVPDASDPSWTSTPPATLPVGTDGTFYFYAWVKDAAGNVSALRSPVAVLVDTTGPAGLSLTTPADEATAIPVNVSLQCGGATDAGVGGVLYRFQITDNVSYTRDSGWIASTSYAPDGLEQGNTYVWSVQAKDALGNLSAATTPRSFTTTAPCVRNNPTVTLLTPGGGIASTISTDAGTSIYNLKVYNNDYGDCGSTTFNLSAVDTDLLHVFNPSTIAQPAITLAPGQNASTTVTVRANSGEDSGMEKTHVVTAADAYHSAVSTGDVQTTLNVVTCKAQTPLLIVGPNSGYLNRAGQMAYTITVKNTDVGAGCSPVTFNLAGAVDSNNTDFNASQLSATTVVLNAGQLASAKLTVSAKSTAAKNAVNLTTLALSAAGHTAPANVTVRSTINNPMLHNSDNTGSAKWAGSGGWGIPGGRYGEFVCQTCHTGGGADSSNVKRVTQAITTPDTSKGTLPGDGAPVIFRRYVGSKKTDPVLGWDAGATPRTSSTKVCEVCHTYDATGANGTKAHPNSTTSALGNHFGTDGTNCNNCHKHNMGFGVAGLSCTGCHGTQTDTITPDNRYVVAPPRNASGASGTVYGMGQVSNDPKVGAHQTHLRGYNGFSNYSTVDYRCQACHGPLPTNFGHINGNSVPAFQGLATRNGAMSPGYSGTTCNNTYCHNPAGAGGTLLSANAGSSVFPSWTSASYVASGAKSVANCQVCHKVPGVAGFEPAGTHSGMNTDSTDCSGCHGHNGDASGTVAGRRHMDGVKWGAGNCDTCHGYDVGSWAAKAERSGVPEGKGAHEKHIAYLKARYSVALLPAGDAFGSGNSWTYVCGVCHNGAAHTMGEAIPGTGRTISISAARQFGGSAPKYNGVVGTSSSVKPKTCSNVDCHYKDTPVWSTY